MDWSCEDEEAFLQSWMTCSLTEVRLSIEHYYRGHSGQWEKVVVGGIGWEIYFGSTCTYKY